jgi:hypothetical protein
MSSKRGCGNVEKLINGCDKAKRKRCFFHRENKERRIKRKRER